jgi:mitochondrial chaperone BCS1
VKEALVKDAMDYLGPASRRWYSDHGIPYRRGYLFYGPPGTGKTSFGFAIAGLLRLNIYIVSLKSPMMNDETLEVIFATLPSRCVVLLEDIDIAGLTHSRLAREKIRHDSNDESLTGQQVLHINISPNTAGVSLPALLNVMDGAASREGRMIIMTTNHVEKLDKALIRPGRIDKTVKFDLADASMIASLFESIFAGGDEHSIVHAVRSNSGLWTSKSPPDTLLPAYELVTNDRKDVAEDGNSYFSKQDPSTAVLEALTQEQAGDAMTSALAHRFAQAIPSGFFSVAEIQSYLLQYKNDPRSAFKNAEDWVKTINGQRLETRD